MSSLRTYLSTSIPEEMDSYLEGLIRGVLKHQPPDINLFAMQYFQSLVDMRKQRGEDKPVHEHDSYPIIISVKNLKTDSKHGSTHDTRDKREAKESSLGEDTTLTSSEINSLTRDLSLQDKSLNSLTFNQSTAPASLEKTDPSSLPIGAMKGDFSSLEQPVTSCSENNSDVKLDSLSEIHTELESYSALTVPKSQSNEEKSIGDEISTTPLIGSGQEINFEIQEEKDDMKTYTIHEVTSEEVSDLFIDDHSLGARQEANMECQENFQKNTNKQDTDGSLNASDVPGKTLDVDIECNLDAIDSNQNKNISKSFPVDLGENFETLDQVENLDGDVSEKDIKETSPNIEGREIVNSEPPPSAECVFQNAESIHSIEDLSQDAEALQCTEYTSQNTEAIPSTGDLSDNAEPTRSTEDATQNTETLQSTEDVTQNAEPIHSIEDATQNTETLQSSEDVTQNAEPIHSIEDATQNTETLHSPEDVTQNTEILQSTTGDVTLNNEPNHSTEGVNQNAEPINSIEDVTQNAETIHSTEDVSQNTAPIHSTEGVTQNSEPLQSTKDVTQSAETIHSTEGVNQNSEPLQSTQNVTQNNETIHSTEDETQNDETIHSTEDVTQSSEPLQSTKDVTQSTDPIHSTDDVTQNAEPTHSTEDATQNSEPLQSTEDVTQNNETVHSTEDETQNAATIHSTDVTQNLELIHSTVGVIQNAEPMHCTDGVTQNSEPLQSTEDVTQNNETIHSTEVESRIAETIHSTNKVTKNLEPLESTENVTQNLEPIHSTEDVTKNLEPLQSTEDVTQNLEHIHSPGDDVTQNSEPLQSTEDVTQNLKPIHSTEDVIKNTEPIHSTEDETQNTETIHSPDDDVTQNSKPLQSTEDVTQNLNPIHSTEDVTHNTEPIHSTEDETQNAETIHSTEDVTQNTELIHSTEDVTQNTKALQLTEDFSQNVEPIYSTEDSSENVVTINTSEDVSLLGGQVNENASRDETLRKSHISGVNTKVKSTDPKLFEKESTIFDKNTCSSPGFIERECMDLPKITVELDSEITDDPGEDLNCEKIIDETNLDPQYRKTTLELPNEHNAQFVESSEFIEIFEENDDMEFEENLIGSRNINIAVPSQEGTKNVFKLSNNETSHLESIKEVTELEIVDKDPMKIPQSDNIEMQPEIFDKEIGCSTLNVSIKEMDMEPQNNDCSEKLSDSALFPDVGSDEIKLDVGINHEKSKIILSKEKLENLKENSNETLIGSLNNIDSTKSKLIRENDKSIDFDEVIGQINPADLQVEEIEELKIFHEIMSSAVKVDSLNMDSSQSESNGSLIPDKVEQTKAVINITNDSTEKVVDSLADIPLKTFVGLPLIRNAPIMISKVIEIKELDEISDDNSIPHVLPSDVIGSDDENSSSIGGTEASSFPQQEIPFKSIIITKVVEPRLAEVFHGEKLVEEFTQPNKEKESMNVCDASISSNEEILDESVLEEHKELDECDEDKEEFSAKIKSIMDQSLLEELEICDILTSAANFSAENAAQSSLSPSSTHDSERKPLDDGSPIHEITRQPISSIREESEDHVDAEHDKIELKESNNNNTDSEDRKSSLRCIGVEATAVRQLAASTGTVAILGTTAKVGLKKSASGNLIEDDTSENADIVEVVIEHNNIIQSNSGTVPQTIEAIAKEVRTDLIKNGLQKPVIHGEVAGDSLVTNESTVNNNSISLDENFNSTANQETEKNNVQKEIDSNVHITSELTKKVSEDISISKENNISNVNIAPSNLDNQILKPKEIVTNNLDSTIPESNIDHYDSTVKAPSLEEIPSTAEIKNDNMDQSSTNINIETRTNSTLDKQSKVPLAKHFKQEVNTSEVITKPKSKSSKESSVEKDISISSFDRNRSVDSIKSDLTNISKTSSLEQYSDNVDPIQSQIKNNTELTKLPSIDSKSVLSSTVSDAVEDIIASATSIVLEKTKTKIAEKSHTEIETVENTDIESKKSMSNDLDSDSNETSDKTVISQESLNEENVREGVTSISISKIPTNKSIDQENSSEKVNDVLLNGELKEEIKKELLPDINGIIKQAEEHVNNFKEELEKIVENGVPDEDSVSLRSKNSFDIDETSVKELTENEKEFVLVKESNERKSTSEDRVLPIILETLPKKIKKELSLSLASQTDESSIEISPENDVSNTVSETSEATKDVFTPHSGNSERTPQYDGTPLSEERTPRIDFPLSDSMMDDLKKEIDGICDEAVARIATATTKIQAGFRGYKTRKSMKQTNNEDEAQESFDGEDYLPPPDLERLGSIHEDDALRPPDEVPDFDADSDFPLPPPSDSASESLSSAATKIQAGVRGYLTRKQVKQGSSTTVPTDSDFSETSATSQDLMRTSVEVETQVQRVEETGRNFRGGKRMSLDSNIREVRPYRPPLRSVVSERDDGDDDDPQEIWRILTQEADKAAVLIQSSFRGYQTRKKLSRGDAVHMPTTSSSATPSSARSEDPAPNPHSYRGTGEFHDAVFGSLTHDYSNNPTIMVSATRNTITDENEAAAKIQAGFRGYKVRRDLKDNSKSDQTCSTSSSSEPLSVEDKSAAKIQAGVRGYLVRKRKNEEKKAATKIQAGFRGYKTRKELKSPGSDENRSLC